MGVKQCCGRLIDFGERGLDPCNVGSGLARRHQIAPALLKQGDVQGFLHAMNLVAHGAVRQVQRFGSA